MIGGFMMRLPIKRKWSLKEQALFIKKIGELLEQGFTYLEALDFLSFHYSSQKKEDLYQAIYRLKEGHTFHQVLYDLSFHPDLVGFVYFAEQHGQMATALQDGSRMYLKRSDERDKLFKVMLYPLFLLVTIMVILVIMNLFVLPKFMVLFQSLNLQQNIFTKIFFVISDSLSISLYLLILITATIICIYIFFFKKCSAIRKATILVKLPLIGSVIKLYYSHYFSIQLSHLLSGGLSIFEALKAFQFNDKTPLYQEVASTIQNELKKGQEFSDAFNCFPFFKHELSSVIKHGQKSGKLSQELFYFSKYCSEQLADQVNKRIQVIQPIVFLLIGIFISSMYLAVMLPVYKMLETI